MYINKTCKHVTGTTAPGILHVRAEKRLVNSYVKLYKYKLKIHKHTMTTDKCFEAFAVKLPQIYPKIIISFAHLQVKVKLKSSINPGKQTSKWGQLLLPRVCHLRQYLPPHTGYDLLPPTSSSDSPFLPEVNPFLFSEPELATRQRFVDGSALQTSLRAKNNK